MSRPDPTAVPGLTVRWIHSSAALRVFTGLLGAVIFTFGVIFATSRVSQLVCTDRGCEVRSAASWLPTKTSPIDPAHPPAVLLVDVGYGKNGNLRGKALRLRFPDEELELARGAAQTVEGQASAVRARLSAGRGALVVGPGPSWFFALMGAGLGALGLAMTVDALGFGVRRRVSFDPATRVFSTSLSVFGLTARRRSVVVPPGARVATIPVHPSMPHGRAWLAVELPGYPAQSLTMLDVPMYRLVVEDVLRAA